MRFKNMHFKTMRSRNLKFSLLIVLLILLPSTLIPLMGQSETILTISIPEWQQDIFTEDIFEEFEAANPGVKIVTVFEQSGGLYIGSEMDEDQINESFNQALESTTSADVLYAQSYSLSVEATRAGLYLDLAPLINNDPSFNADDFFPAVWESYQWDNGIWAVPTTANVTLLVYDAAKFDEAGLPYPDANWTLADLANAAEAFTVYDDEGETDLPGLAGFNLRYLIVSLLGEGLLDQDVIPNEPRLNTPELQALVDEWSAMLDAGTVQPYGDFDNNEVAMSVDQPYRLFGFNPQDDTHEWQASLLPGGKAGLDVTGFAVSAGTSNPELAYELVKYLSLSPEIASANYGSYPARQSLVGVEVENPRFIMPPMEEEVTLILEDALANAIPVADVQFYNYISQFFEIYPQMPGMDASEMPEPPTLDELQQQSVDVLAIAETLRGSQVVAVATPVPTPVLGEGEIVIRFRLGMPFSPIPNRETWDAFIAEYTANDPTVGNIDLLTGFGGPAQEEEVDCYYSFDNMVPYVDLTTLIALDPFMDADPNFDESDVLGTTMTQLQRENATWGYPMTVQPSLISYNSEIFEEAGVDAPLEDWTVEEFATTLQALMDSNPELEYAFDSNDFGPTYLYMLMAAYGGVPIDYTTQPTTYNLSDPDTLNAIRQVLDLAKSGVLNYRQLDNNMGGGSFTGLIPMQGTNMTSMAWELGYRTSPDAASNEFVNPMRYVLYPRGSQYTPMSYTVGVGYITSTAANPEACYQLLTEIASRPELLLGIPARRSMATDSNIATLFGEDVAAFFNMFASQLDAPDAVVIPAANASSGSYTSYFETIWINQAFDNYVLEDGDLEADLALAETNIEAYRTCVGDDGSMVDTSNMEQEELEEFFAKYTDCAVEVDPTLASRFQPIETES
jgi:ABC-type glycerol-3-phosphate transport system substrate-binding protein